MPFQAVRLARVALGSLPQSNLIQDLRYAARILRKSPTFTAIGILSLALGITSAVFSVADALLLRPLPVPSSSEIATISSTAPGVRATAGAISYPDYVDLRDDNQSFQDLTAFTYLRAGMARKPTPEQTAKFYQTLIERVFAEKYWPGLNPIGRRFRLDDRTGPWVQVVGVAKTTWYAYVGEDREPFFYLPMAQNPQMGMTLMVETATPEAAGFIGPLRNLVGSIDGRQPVFKIRTMQEYYPRQALQALRIVLAQGLTLALIGVGLGLTGSIGLARTIRALFTRLQERGMCDAWIFVAVPVALIAVAIVASYIPAHRATGIDPNEALRYE